VQLCDKTQCSIHPPTHPSIHPSNQSINQPINASAEVVHFHSDSKLQTWQTSDQIRDQREDLSDNAWRITDVNSTVIFVIVASTTLPWWPQRRHGDHNIAMVTEGRPHNQFCKLKFWDDLTENYILIIWLQCQRT